jgi:transposase
MKNLIYVAIHIGYMGSIYYIERNGNRYAYESTSRRVPGKKNPVTDKVYLGRVDPETGKIIPKESTARPAEEHAKHYGSAAVLDAVQKKLGLSEDLGACFQELGPNILGAAMSQTVDATSFDDIHYVVDGSIIKERLKLRGSLSPAVMSGLSKKVGESFASADDFFRARIKRASDPLLTLDLTSVSTHSDMNGWAEWGYNRDGESLRQTNIAMAVDGKGIPLAFTMLPGSIADSAVLDGTVEYLLGLGCGGRLVMDRGFETAANAKALLDRNVKFTMPSKAQAEPIKKLMSMAVADMRSPDSFRMHEKRTYKAAEYRVGVVGKKKKEDDEEEGFEYLIRLPPDHKDAEENNELFDRAPKLAAFVVYDPRKASDDLDKVAKAVAAAERDLNGRKFRDPKKTFSELPAFVRRYIEYSVDGEGLMRISRRQNAFAFADNRAGMFVMLASEGTGWEEMMSSYDVRDWVEKAFDVYKTDLDGSRSRTGDPDRARGRLFIKFVALMMRVHIQNLLRSHDEDAKAGRTKKDSVNGRTVDEIMRSLNTLMAIGNAGDWRLTAVSKSVREIFALFGLEEPKSGAVSLS